MDNIKNLIRAVVSDEYTNIESDPSQHPYTKNSLQENNVSNSNITNLTDKFINSTKTESSTPNTPIPTDPVLLDLYHQCLACRACELCNSALNLVFGDGNPNADIMVIGEAPGADEDQQGRPFVGRAGQLLIKLLNKYGVSRDSIFIANILKHRPPNNRNPLPNEITACTPFLRKQIDIIQPKLLITLGNFSSQYILNTKEGITKIRGTFRESSYGMVMPSLHPSAIIRGAYPVELLEKDIVTALQFAGYSVEFKEN